MQQVLKQNTSLKGLFWDCFLKMLEEETIAISYNTNELIRKIFTSSFADSFVSFKELLMEQKNKDHSEVLKEIATLEKTIKNQDNKAVEVEKIFYPRADQLEKEFSVSNSSKTLLELLTENCVNIDENFKMEFLTPFDCSHKTSESTSTAVSSEDFFFTKLSDGKIVFDVFYDYASKILKEKNSMFSTGKTQITLDDLNILLYTDKRNPDLDYSFLNESVYLEFIDPKVNSNKFYRITRLQNNNILAEYGRIGKNPSEKIYSYKTKSFDALLYEKERKGYIKKEDPQKSEASLVVKNNMNFVKDMAKLILMLKSSPKGTLPVSPNIEKQYKNLIHTLSSKTIDRNLLGILEKEPFFMIKKENSIWRPDAVYVSGLSGLINHCLKIFVNMVNNAEKLPTRSENTYIFILIEDFAELIKNTILDDPLKYFSGSSFGTIDISDISEKYCNILNECCLSAKRLLLNTINNNTIDQSLSKDNKEQYLSEIDPFYL